MDRIDGRTLEPGKLLPLALSRPQEALTKAEQVLASTTDATSLSYARQAIGIVLRDGGLMAAAIRELRTALLLAEATGQPDRVADVRATLGAALVMDGSTRTGLGQLDAAARGSRGRTHATVLMRRAYVLSLLGRHEEALTDMRRAIRGIRRCGDAVWEARALNNRADIHLALGDAPRAERDVALAEQLFHRTGQELEAVHALHNRGLIAFAKGDLPMSLSLYDQAATRYAALGVDASDLAIDRCVALLAAGLDKEAKDVVATALQGHPRQPTQQAELLLMLARSALSMGEAASALESAAQARRRFIQQDRVWWALQAELVECLARYSIAGDAAEQLPAVVSIARRLEAVHAEEAPLALTLAGRLARSLGLDSCHEYFAAAARYRRKGPALVRARGWLATALGCQAAGDVRGAWTACARGLDALTEHRTTLGSTELRALAGRHGEELVEIALKLAVASGRGRALLRWSEMSRATALALPPVHPPSDPGLAAALAAVRDVVRRLDDARAVQTPSKALEEERLRLEQEVRRRRLAVAGDRHRPGQLDIGHLLDALAEEALVEITDVGGTLYAVVARHRRVRRFEVGPTGAALHSLEVARFALRQAARERPAALGAVGRRLEEALLGAVVGALGDGPVLVSPTGSTHATPWGLLPALSDRPVSVVPSAAIWLRACERGRDHGGGTVLIGGPGLPTEAAELLALARRWPAAVVLRGGSATVERALAAMDGASLVHVVAHGRFRSDNPMFSSLTLDDGPLTVHDFERLRRAPRRLVLSACESGVMAPVGANELLGLASALLSLGATGLVSSVAEVNDAATGELMVNLHAGLERDADMAEALAAARLAARGDEVREATAAAFVAIGV